MSRVYLLLATAVIEVGAGLLLLLIPLVSLMLLFGVPQAAPEVGVVVRIAGAALLALGVACALARNDAMSRAATGLIAAMLLYNTSVAAILVLAALLDGLHGIALWPGVALHTAMAVWCLACIRIPR